MKLILIFFINHFVKNRSIYNFIIIFKIRFICIKNHHITIFLIFFYLFYFSYIKLYQILSYTKFWQIWCKYWILQLINFIGSNPWKYFMNTKILRIQIVFWMQRNSKWICINYHRKEKFSYITWLNLIAKWYI